MFLKIKIDNSPKSLIWKIAGLNVYIANFKICIKNHKYYLYKNTLKQYLGNCIISQGYDALFNGDQKISINIYCKKQQM